MTNLPYQRSPCCRVCKATGLHDLLDLGDQPLANALKKARDEREMSFPLTLSFCTNCSLIQIRETVDKEGLFSRYFWVTGTSKSAKSFANEFCSKALDVRRLSEKDYVLEIASNDGTFLKPFIEKGIDVLGVDPASNIARIASEQGIPTLNAFWDQQTADIVVAQRGKASFVFARNVIAHASQLHDVMKGFHSVLSGDGVGAVEFHYAGNIHGQLQYDAIYHEHLCYFSIASFNRLLQFHGLFPWHIEPSPISGGAYVVYFTKEHRVPTAQYSALVLEESGYALTELSSWRKFAERCREHRRQSRELMSSFHDKKVVAFGASARSSTYLNFCGFSFRDIDAVIDNNELKHGHFTPGASIPIVSRKQGFVDDPEVVVLLAWNFKEEIVETCRASGFAGKFLLPFPDSPVISSGEQS